MKNITLKTIYKKVIRLQQDVNQMKKILTEEPELRDEFILRMKHIENEKAVIVKDFGKRYGLK